MNRTGINISFTETPDYRADERSLHEIGGASDQEVLGKWALYFTLFDQGEIAQEDWDSAVRVYDRLDFERRYREGEFDKTDSSEIPPRYSAPVQIFKAAWNIGMFLDEQVPDDTILENLINFVALQQSPEYEQLTDNQREVVSSLINVLSYRVFGEKDTPAGHISRA